MFEQTPSRLFSAGRFVDVVVVTYNSAASLRPCVAPLAGVDGIAVVIVDNSSSDDTLATIDDLALSAVPLHTNVGFGAGCNVGWRSTSAPYVLFLNPDARISPDAVLMLAARAGDDPHVGAVAPRLVTPAGGLDFSLRRFPRLRSTYARALFLHRAFPRAKWVDEVIRDPGAYSKAHSVEWATGACLLVRRDALERVNGFDERFFMYCEDKDLCARLWEAGYSVEYEPGIVCEHEGGKGSEASRAARRSMLTRSRLLYARAHSSRVAAQLERLGLALEAVVRLVSGSGGSQGRSARVGELRVLLHGLGSGRS